MVGDISPLPPMNAGRHPPAPWRRWRPRSERYVVLSAAVPPTVVLSVRKTALSTALRDGDGTVFDKPLEMKRFQPLICLGEPGLAYS
jgi:hypothetical protein